MQLLIAADKNENARACLCANRNASPTIDGEREIVTCGC
jgi:hypothetical protein